MPLNWPVEVNFHEAKAFCNWKGKGYRMLTEAEHHAIRENEVIHFDTYFFSITSSTLISFFYRFMN